MATITKESSSWLDRPLASLVKLDVEKLIFGSIMFVAVFSRLYDLGARVMSHDEINHVYFAWQFFKGSEYAHHPLSHGPFQFHILYLSYFLLGVTDFTARFPAALFSIASVFFIWKFRRYFGRIGTLVTAGLMVISPFLLYYGRYARNEAFTVLWGLVTIWAILRYLEMGETKYLYYLVAVTAFNYTTKETVFIYLAQALLFLGFLFVFRVTQQDWDNNDNRRIFLRSQLASYAFFALALLIRLFKIPSEELTHNVFLVVLGLGGVAFLISLVFLLQGYGLPKLRRERSFELIILLLTMTLPHLAAFPATWFGVDPMSYSSTEGILQNAAVLLPMILIAVAVGVWWRRREWLISFAIFYAIFIPLYTSMFTNGAGLFSGIMGSLGYWIGQQAVQRGSQPWYYYILVLVPIYEFLPALVTLAATGWGINRLFRPKKDADEEEEDNQNKWIEDPETGVLDLSALKAYAFVFLLLWSYTAVIAYMVAGEKMPWLTVHITWPMCLVAGWSMGYLIEKVDWAAFKEKRGWVVVGLFVLFLVGMITVFVAMTGPVPPFQGKDLIQLRATNNFLMSFLAVVASAYGLVRILKEWQSAQAFRILILIVVGMLALITARTAITSSYFNYDLATEYLVYAHAGPGPKDILKQVDDISMRVTGGYDLQVAYDNHAAYPFWWYFRDYKNQNAYGENPSRQLREYPVILVGESNYSKIEPIVGQGYYSFEYIRMWWPNQDYFDLSFVNSYLKDPATRVPMLNAMLHIWLNRDYEPYGEVISRDMSIENWTPSNKMRMYVRKDILSQVWEYGVGPTADELIIDPYEENILTVSPAFSFSLPSGEDDTFAGPHDIAFAQDGSLYVVETNNHRVLHFSPEGELLNSWGGYALVESGAEAPGSFNQPWGIAVGEDGSVYVADTWNHRIQKFTADGEFVTLWGMFGQGEDPNFLWGPRDIVIDSSGNLLVTDTGNKRILVFDGDGNFVQQVGSVGYLPGQLDEPVGLAIDQETGWLFVADTWNQRVQVFSVDANGFYEYANSWDIVGWYGESLDNKPYLTVDENGFVYVAEPESGRIIVFDRNGAYKYSFGNSDVQIQFGLVGGIAADGQGGLWISDTPNGQLFYFEITDLGR